MAKSLLLLLVKSSMIILAVVWASVWVMKPTQIWTRKWKEAEDAAKTTVIGSYGLDFVVYSFPIMGSVMIGFIYLHFKPNGQRGRSRRRSLIASLSNPIIVNSFVGVLSAMEALVFFMFIVFLAWTFYLRVSNDVKKMMPARSLMKLNMWQYMTFRVATRSGLLAEACLALLIFPIMRGMTVFQLFGIQFEASVRYHIWLGTLMLSFATLHGVGTLFIWGIKKMLQDEVLQWQKTGRIYLAGEISLVTGMVIWITSLPQVRRKRFEIFYYTHHLYTIFLIFFLFHTGDRHFYMVLPAILIFAIERLLRMIQSTPETCILSARIFPLKAIEVVLPKDPRLKYTPTSIIFIKIPSISKFQWHSFSIASSSLVDDDTMSIIIKCDGSWTNALYDIIQGMPIGPDQRARKCIPVSVEGPYGPISTEFLSKYDSLLLIAGGIGVTPFLSILQEISSARRNSFPTKIQLVYIIKKSNSLSILNSVLPLLTSKNTNEFNFKLKIYVTQETQSGATISEMMREFSQFETVKFETGSISYSPNGYGNSLSKAAIIGFTSFLFFVLLVTFSHVFLPQPKKASSKEKTKSSLVDLIVMFAFFLSIIISMMVFSVLRLKSLRKQRPLLEFKHKGQEIQASSLQSNRNLDEHEIHFGSRPNFHDIFKNFPNETGGSYVGVLVCGPEKMKESVASVCRLSSQSSRTGAEKKNPYFNFHSLNFTL